MKKVLKSLLLACVLVSGFSFAASCDIDKSQMYDQIRQYDSISTKGCPYNGNGWGINKVNQVNDNGDGSCSATCYYALAQGSSGVPCDWAKGNWGDTLNCH